MKKNLLQPLLFGFIIAAAALVGCTKNNDIEDGGIPDADRWITISGSQDDPSNNTVGDGNLAVKVYSVSAEDAKDPNTSINVFTNGHQVKSQRTARLQASADGKELYNIQYTGADGGIFNKYLVKGGSSFTPDGAEVETAVYVSASPRWVKALEGVGVAVRATANDALYTGTAPNFIYQQTTSKIDAITLDLKDPRITKTTSFDLALSSTEVAEGYYVSRIDVPVVNSAQNKVYIGAAISKVNPASFTIETNGTPEFTTDNSVRSWAKTLVLDYPSLANPKIITSNQTRGNTNGYRSTMQYVGDDGHVYQATTGELSGGSKILRISSATNDYDNNYVFSLDQALGVENSYIYTWRYVGDGIGYVVYALQNAAGERAGSYVARIDLNAKTASKYSIPNEANLSYFQIQNIAINGDDVFICLAPIGQNGNIYVFNRKTGTMTVGAKLINEAGGQYIGAY